jgi:hypothetical protein
MAEPSARRRILWGGLLAAALGLGLVVYDAWPWRGFASGAALQPGTVTET